MCTNYKENDRHFIMSYIKSREGIVSIEDIKNHSGADKLRVYTIVFEQIDAGVISVVEKNSFGSPISVQLCK